MKKLLVSLGTTFLVLFVVCSNLWSAPVTFFGEDLGLGEDTPLSAWPNAQAAENAFLANLSGTGTEDFESFADGTSAPLALTFPGAGTATLLGDGYIDEAPVSSTNGAGRYATSGTHYWESETNNFSITFSDPIAAFGFYGIDLGDFLGQVTLTASGGTSEVLTIPHTVGSPGGSIIYFGFYDTQNTYQTITFGNSGSASDIFAYDDMTIGSLQQVTPNNVPEPATLLLLGPGLLGVAAFKRKKSL